MTHTLQTRLRADAPNFVPKLATEKQTEMPSRWEMPASGLFCPQCAACLCCAFHSEHSRLEDSWQQVVMQLKFDGCAWNRPRAKKVAMKLPRQMGRPAAASHKASNDVLISVWGANAKDTDDASTASGEAENQSESSSPSHSSPRSGRTSSKAEYVESQGLSTAVAAGAAAAMQHVLHVKERMGTPATKPRTSTTKAWIV